MLALLTHCKHGTKIQIMLLHPKCTLRNVQKLTAIQNRQTHTRHPVRLLEFFQRSHLIRLWRSAEAAFKGSGNGVAGLGEGLGGLLHEVAVHQPQGLQGCGRRAAAGATGQAVCAVEEHLLMREVVAALCEVQALAVRCGWLADSATLWVELAGHLENRIADSFRFQSTGCPAPVGLVVRIDIGVVNFVTAGLPVGG